MRLVYITILFLLVLFLPPSIRAQQGCCSYHGGINYCDSSVGRYVCNDGTYSPSCGCTYIPQAQIYTPPTPITNPTYYTKEVSEYDLDLLNKKVQVLTEENLSLRSELDLKTMYIYLLIFGLSISLIGMAFTRKYPFLIDIAQWILGIIAVCIFIWLLSLN